MEQTTYTSRLRYLDADDIDDSVVDFDDLDVIGSDGNKLGEVEGFLVDPSNGRLMYAVVDSGGWFRSRRFLMPIGVATIDTTARQIRVQVGRDNLRDYPDFDEDRFRSFNDDDFRGYEQRMTSGWGGAHGETGTTAAFGSGLHYTQPAWWTPTALRSERLRPIERRPFREREAMGATHTSTQTRDALDREHVTAHSDERDDRSRAGDVSPHLDGRAQPGDVLGIETGGETTGIGDTREDEDKRRRAAEKSERND